MEDNSRFKKYTDQFSHFHLGSGTDEKPEPFLNIDYFTNGPHEDLVQLPNGYYYLNYDLTKGIPAPDNSLIAIYHSHFLEHFSISEGVAILQECYRSLKPEGVMRFAVPDLEFWIESYLKNKSHFFRSYLSQDSFNDIRHINSTKAMVWNLALYGWGHKAVYDYETLNYLLLQIGFKDVTRSSHSTGNFNLHSNDQLTRGDNLSNAIRAIESIYIECKK